MTTASPMSSGRRRRTLICLVLTAAAAGAAATPALAGTHFDEGHYRAAKVSERRAMSKAAAHAGSLSVHAATDWQIGEIDARAGYVCGDRNGDTAGVFLVRRHGRWAAPKSPTSGEIQTADYLCGAYD